MILMIEYKITRRKTVEAPERCCVVSPVKSVEPKCSVVSMGMYPRGKEAYPWKDRRTYPREITVEGQMLGRESRLKKGWR